MTDNARALRIWSLAWGSTYAAATVSQGIIAGVTNDRDLRIDMIAGGIAAAVGTASLYLLPLRITRPAWRVHDALGRPDRCALLEYAESEFFATAEVDALSAGWGGHVGNVVVNATLALILGFGYGHWRTAAISAGAGVVVGEINLLTQPHRLVDAEKRYRAGQLTSPGEKLSVSIVPMMGPDFAGISLSLTHPFQ